MPTAALSSLAATRASTAMRPSSAPVPWTEAVFPWCESGITGRPTPEGRRPRRPTRSADPAQTGEQDDGADGGQPDKEHHNDEPRKSGERRILVLGAEEAEDDRGREQHGGDNREHPHDLIRPLRNPRVVEGEGAIDRIFGRLQAINHASESHLQVAEIRRDRLATDER